MDQTSPSGRHQTPEPVLTSRLLPRVSFRSLLLLTGLSGIVIAVAYSADQGGKYASAVFTGLAFLGAVVVASALLFLFSWAVSYLPRVLGAALVAVGLLMMAMRLLRIGAGPLTEWISLINFQLVGWSLLVIAYTQRKNETSESPFAADQLPPQILKPRDPVN